MQVKFAYDNTVYEGASIGHKFGLDVSELMRKGVTDWKKFRTEYYERNRRCSFDNPVQIPADGSVVMDKFYGIYFVGGRNSIYDTLKGGALSYTKFLAPHGTALGFVTGRKKSKWSKNLTVVELIATRASDYNSGMWAFDAKRFTDPVFGLGTNPNLWLEIYGHQLADAVWNFYGMGN